MWEVVVPTCSYRMGVQQMGLGVARLNKQGDVFYANLWLPSRWLPSSDLLICYQPDILTSLTPAPSPGLTFCTFMQPVLQ